MRVFLLLSVLFLAACAQTSSGEISNPLERRWTWIDFISAGDIRRECRPGSADRVRFVLNADRSKQVRAYDFNVEEATLRTRIHRPRVPFSAFRIDSSIASYFTPVDDTVRLEQGAAAGIVDALASDRAGKAGSAPDPLLTEWHFWLVGACVDGSFTFDIWVSPDADYRALRFPAELFSHDISNVPVVTQGAERRLGLHDYNPARQEAFSHYLLHLREDRVVLGQNYGEDQSFP